jgi:hypothetical protein
VVALVVLVVVVLVFVLVADVTVVVLVVLVVRVEVVVEVVVVIVLVVVVVVSTYIAFLGPPPQVRCGVKRLSPGHTMPHSLSGTAEYFCFVEYSNLLLQRHHPPSWRAINS